METPLTATLPVAATTERARPRHKARSGSRLRLALLVLVVLIVGAAWPAFRWWKARTTAGPPVDQFTVVPRTFSVVIKEKGELKASKSTDIKSEVEGRCTIISLIAEGTSVKEGDLLVQLASDQIDERIRQEELKETNALTAYESAKTELEIQQDRNLSDIRKAELDIELKRLALERYEKGDWEQQLKDAKIAIEQAEVNLKRRDEDYEAAKQLYEKKFITLTEYNEDQFNFQKAEWEKAKAEKALEVLERYTHVVELKKHESDLDEAIKECERVKKNAAAEETKKLRALEGAEKELAINREQLAKFRGQKEKTRIVAPTQGFVVYAGGGGGWGMRGMGGEDQIKEGAEVYERQLLMQLPDMSEMMVVVRVHEAKTDKLHVGQPVSVEVEGVPGRQFAGKVTKIAVIADSQNRWLNPDLKEYETEITLDPTDAVLKPGVTAFAEILVGNVDEKLAVPVQSVFNKGGRRFVFKQDGRDVKPIEVHPGAVSAEWAEITEGVTDGERILLAFGDEHKRLIPDAPGGDRRGGPPGGPGKGGPRRAGGPPGQPGGQPQPSSAGAPASTTSPTAATAVPSPGGPPRRDAATSAPTAGAPAARPASAKPGQ